MQGFGLWGPTVVSEEGFNDAMEREIFAIFEPWVKNAQDLARCGESLLMGLLGKCCMHGKRVAAEKLTSLRSSYPTSYKEWALGDKRPHEKVMKEIIGNKLHKFINERIAACTKLATELEVCPLMQMHRGFMKGLMQADIDELKQAAADAEEYVLIAGVLNVLEAKPLKEDQTWRP